MHHFIYPIKDTFITSETSSMNENFGLSEVLRLGSDIITTPITNLTQSIVYNNTYFIDISMSDFTGTLLTSSIRSTAQFVSGTIVNSGSNLTFDVSYFSGSIDSVGYSSLSGSIYVSSSINGFISGSLIACPDPIFTFNGILSGSSGLIFYGTGSATDLVNQQSVTTQDEIIASRILIQFNIDSISSSISNGNIASPVFNLKLKSAKEENLPLSYSIFSFPLSQSWEMGNGYFSDGGSLFGTNWNYRDFYSGSLWDTTGGTWQISGLYSSVQQFNYQSSDISMDISNIVYGWISGSIPNNGIILLCSGELQNSSSSMMLYFFSKDTNTIYSPYIDVGWDDSVFITGSIITSSVIISTLPPGLIGSVVANSSITNSNVNGLFTGYSNVTYDINSSASGIISGVGFSGSVTGFPIYGSITGSLSSSYTSTTTSSLLLAQLTDGYFSGSVFTSSISGVQLISGSITGSWNLSQLLNNTLSSSYPFLNYPDVIIATTTGSFIYGTILGSVFVSNPTGSGLFKGSIIDGPYINSIINFYYSGSILTSSYSYTSSILFTSSILTPLDINRPFSTVIQNLPSTVKFGDIIKINVFSRDQFPLKDFNRTTQLSQFLIPKYLPPSSYYSIMDNETEQIIVNFDNNTKLSCDLDGNYFLLDTTGLPQERYFKVLIKIVNGFYNSSFIIDGNDIFKIVR